MRTRIRLAAAAMFAFASASAAETPTMGWSSWNAYHVNISYKLIMRQADLLVELGLDKLGYRYVNIDDGWFGGRDANGRLKTHPERFPDGLSPVVRQVHGLGLKAGIYSDGGENTCGSFYDNDTLGIGAGFYGHDREDAQYFFGDHDFDFIKIDFCGGDPKKNVDKLMLDEKERYTAIRRAIDGVKKGVRLNICRWDYPGTWVRDVGSSWRMSRDIRPKWGVVKGIIKENLYLSAYAAPGAYNDMDMLEVGRGMSAEEDYTHFAVWCMMSSPLLIGCDLEKVKNDPPTLAILSDRDLIALDQDTASPQAYVVKREGESYVLVRDVDVPFGNARAVAFVNLEDSQRGMEISLRELDLSGAASAKDLKRGTEDAVDGKVAVTVPAHGARIYIVSAERRLEREVYEAETAYLSTYQELHDPKRAGTGWYRQREGASGGVVAAGLGGRSGNDLVWDRIWSERGGEYQMSLATFGAGGEVHVEVNGEEASAPNRVVLKPGMNSIRLFNDVKRLPEIDFMRLSAVTRPSLPERAGDRAKFIGAGPGNGTRPCCVKKTVVNEKAVVRAAWRVSGLGVFVPLVNGRDAAPEEVLLPGYTHFKKRRHEIALDVTRFWNKEVGATNELSALCTSGWWCDKIAGKNGGTWPAFRGVLELTDAGGTVVEHVTDESWLATTKTALTECGIWEGTSYDSRVEPSEWREAVVSGEFKGEISPRIGPPIVMRNDLRMEGEDFGLAPGETKVVDFGQNAAAIPILRIRGKSGTKVAVRLGEMLNDGVKGHHGDGPRGSVYLANMRGAKAGFDYVCNGVGAWGYMPAKTFFGYRYASITADGAVEGYVASAPVSSVSREMEHGMVETGREDVNRLVKNAYWGMLSNYLSIPTDCPQRTERYGWTGDAQVFAKTGAYFADIRSFMRKWMQDVRDTQAEDGSVPLVCPIGAWDFSKSLIAGWSDAAVIVPWTMWKYLGDEEIVREKDVGEGVHIF